MPPQKSPFTLPTIDPQTGERMEEPSAFPTIDPTTGERASLNPVENLFFSRGTPINLFQPLPAHLTPPEPDYVKAAKAQKTLETFPAQQNAAIIPSFLKTVGQGALGLAQMAVTPPLTAATELATQTAPMLAQGDVKGLATLGVEQATGIPVSSIAHAAAANQPGQAVGEALGGLALAGGMLAGGKALHDAGRRPTPPAATPPTPPPLPTAAELGRLGPEFIPVGAEPAYTAPRFTPPIDVPANVKLNRGRSPERGPTAAQVALGVEATHLPAIDPRTGERVAPVPEPLPPPRMEPAGSQGPSAGILDTLRNRLGDEQGAVGDLSTSPGPIWYSRLQKALPSWPESAHPNKYMSLAKASTSADEVKWSGLEQFLQERARSNQKVTKAEVADLLNENRFTVEEVLLHDPNDRPDITDVTDPLAPDAGDLPLTKFHPTSGHAESLSLPGGRNYKELLIKWPTDKVDPASPAGLADQLMGRTPPADVYSSPHWPGQPNVLAHVRFNDRTGPDGAKILHIEEIQSDWHQAGREKGYGPPDRATQITKIRHANVGTGTGVPAHVRLALDTARRQRQNLPPPIPLDTLLQRYADGDLNLNRLEDLLSENGYATPSTLRQGGVPDAPFKDNAWQQMAMKRILRYAAEKGYDRVTWTTGLQQTTRYNKALGEALGEGRLDWSYEPPQPAPDYKALGSSDARAVTSDNVELLHPKTGELLWLGPRDELPGVVGKDLAARIVADIDTSRRGALPGDTIIRHGKTQIPTNLTAGSPGMIQEYDTNLVNFTNKFMKGWGGKVGKVDILTDFPEKHPPNLSQYEWDMFRQEGETALRQYLAEHLGDTRPENIDRHIRYARAWKMSSRAKEPVWSVPITPQMREAVVREGMPLGFQTLQPLIATGGAAAGATYGFTQGEDTDDRIRNAFLFGGLGLAGGLLAPKALEALTRQKTPDLHSQLSKETKIRLQANAPSPYTSGAESLARAWEIGKNDIVRETLIPERRLRDAGLGDAADLFTKYKSERLDVLTTQLNRLKTVVAPITDPKDYRTLSDIITLRRDVANADMGKTLESNLDPDIAARDLAFLESHASPAVLQAAADHKALMAEVGQDLVNRGLMDPSTLARNSAYVPEMVLDYLLKAFKPAVPHLTRKAPIKAIARPFLKEHKGGERETLHDYGLVMMKYLTKVAESNLRDDFIKAIRKKYDQVGQPGLNDQPITAATRRLPPGYVWWLYQGGDGKAMVIPKTLASRLDQWQQTPGPLVKAIHRGTNMWKAVTLRAIWGGFSAQNYLGDVFALFTFNPITSWPEVARNLGEAHAAVARQMRGQTSARGQGWSTQRQNLFLAELGRQEGLGTGAATAEVSSQRDPILRQMRPPHAEWTREHLWRPLGDAVAWSVNKMDLMREYLENVPRLAEFMTRLSEGDPPPSAARVTRKVMIDYADLSPNEENFLRGVAVPFYAFYKKNIARYTPGLSDVGAAESGKAIARGMGLLMAATAYNQTIAPSYEDSLPDYLKNTFHLILPWKGTKNGEVEYFAVFVSDPLTLTLNAVGAGGIPQRLVSLYKGQSDLEDVTQESKNQAWNAATSVVSPLFQIPYGWVSGKDLRTGRQIASPNATIPQKISAYLQHAANSLSPITLTARAKREAGDTTDVFPGTAEGWGELAKQHVIGGVVRGGTFEENYWTKAYQAVGKASAKMARDTEQEGLQAATDWARTNLAGKSPKEVATTWLRMMKADDAAYVNGAISYQDLQKRQKVMLDGLKQAAAVDRRLVRFLKQAQVAMQRIGEKKGPYVEEEFTKLPKPPTPKK